MELMENILGIVPWQEVATEDKRVRLLVEEREKARQRKDWAKADALREEIKSLGYVVEDTPLGVRFYRREGGEG